MYEQYLRDPASVPEEWRQLFDNGHLTELPVIQTSRAEVLESGEKAAAPSVAPVSPTPHTPHPTGLTPIIGPAARLGPNNTHSPFIPTSTSVRRWTAHVS